MEQASGRIPSVPLDENVLLRVLYWETRIEMHGPKWCKANLVGAMRRKALTPKYTNLLLISDGRGRSFEEVRLSTARRLATFCALCGQCEYARLPPS